MQPRSIPVNVYLPAHAPTDALFGGTDMDAFALGGAGPTRRARIVMTAPERPPISGLVEIGVTFDPSRPRGGCGGHQRRDGRGPARGRAGGGVQARWGVRAAREGVEEGA